MSPTRQTPPTDRPLTAGDVPLLREGDVLRVVDFCSGGPVAGSEVTFHHATSCSVWLGPDEDSDNDGWAFNRFTFVARPATSAASEGAERALEDAVAYGVGFIVDGKRVAPERVTVCHGAALASPHVSERERELEGLVVELLKHSVSHYGNPKDADHGVGLIHARARALTAQPAGEK